MTIENAKSARKLYEKVVSGVAYKTVDVILVSLEEAINKGYQVTYYKFTKDTTPFRDQIEAELKSRGFDVEYNSSSYSDFRKDCPASLTVSFQLAEE